MTLLHVHFWSPALAKQSAAFVTIPDGHDGRPLPVVYQLHGLSDDHTMWQRRTSIERYAQRHGLMVVMPDGGRGYYLDARHGVGAYESHLLAVVDFVDRTFRTIAAREGRALGGLSMGGYGALKLALKHPARFASVVAHSSALDLARMLRDGSAVRDLQVALDGRLDPGDDCFALAGRLARSAGPRPAIAFDCGLGDQFLADNRRFHARLERLGIAHRYREHPGGHDWEYWDAHLDAALAFHRARLGSA